MLRTIWRAIPLWVGVLLAPLFFLLGTLLRYVPLPLAVLIGFGVWLGTLAVALAIRSRRPSAESDHVLTPIGAAHVVEHNRQD